MLTSEEKGILGTILKDLEFLFNIQEILPADLDRVISSLKSDEVKRYLSNLGEGSKPETALREALLAGGSVLSKYLFGELTPEVYIGEGFTDYLIHEDRNMLIILELKPLFEADFEDYKGKRRLQKIKQVRLKWEFHKEQLEKYILNKNCEFVVLTNLRDWFLCSRISIQTEKKPFFTANLTDFIQDYKVIRNIADYLERKEFQYHREDLDKKFFNSLTQWINLFTEVEFKLDDKRKLEAIVNLINKFIFVQTLDDYGIIPFRWIKNTWDHAEQKWKTKSKLRVLEEFFNELDVWFFEYYDTELFKGKILHLVNAKAKNIDKFYANLQKVLGITSWQEILGGYQGVLQYKFKYIDEDIFGKAYEVFLAEIRREQGIYYTPRYVTEYIVNNAVDNIFDNLAKEIYKAVKAEDYTKAKELSYQFISLKILDPACGSGSFLIKAIRAIYKKYRQLDDSLKETKNNYQSYMMKENALFLPKKIQRKVNAISQIIEILKSHNKRELISRIIVRHIHGNDLDMKALEVAKVNIWLEAIKLAPEEFRYDRLPPMTNRILPYLEMNLGNGDSLIGLSIQTTQTFLKKNYKNEIKKLFKLRKDYLDNPSNPELVEQIENIKMALRKKLDEELMGLLTGTGTDSKILKKVALFNWGLEFWYVFMDESCNILPEDVRGFDVVIGNPPYYTEARGYKNIFRIYSKSPLLQNYYEKNMDVFYFFIEVGLELLKQGGNLGFIIMEYWNSRTSGAILRNRILSESLIYSLVNFDGFKVFKEALGQHNSILLLKKQSHGKTMDNYTVQRIEVKDKDVREYEIKEALINNRFTEKITKDAVKVIFDTTLQTVKFMSAETEDLISKIVKASNYRLPEDNVMKGLATMVSKAKTGEGVFILSDKELKSMSLCSEEKKLIKPFYHARQIDNYFFDKVSQEWLIYSTKRYIDYEDADINKLVARGAAKEKIKEIQERVKTKYPTIVKHLDRFQDIITSDKRPYGLHRPKNEDAFLNPNKIISVRKTEYPKFMNVVSSCFMDDAVYYIIPSDKISPKFLLALLNSKLMWYWFRYGAQKTHGDQLQIDKGILKNAPLIRLEGSQEKVTIEKVGKIITLKTALYKLMELWNEWQKTMRNNTISLYQILSNEAIKHRSGDFSKGWTSQLKFYPERKNEILNRTYEKFKIVAGVTEPKIEIFGLSKEITDRVYDITFNNRELMLHVYFSLNETLMSRLEIKTLLQLFLKTMVPVIQPNIIETTETTLNIIKKVMNEFEKWIKTEKRKYKIDADIVKISHEIKKVEAQIDAAVFSLYGLNNNEAKTIMDSLNIIPSYQEIVFTYF